MIGKSYIFHLFLFLLILPDSIYSQDNICLIPQVESMVRKKGTLSIERLESIHFPDEWKNTGNGYLPNNIPNWNYKYKPAFALFDLQGNLVQTWVDDNAEPSDWLHNTVHSYTYPVTFTDIPKGTYQWAVAIIDQTKDQQPGIKLAIKDKQEKKGWFLLNEIVIQ
jgi:hypothetical protein